MNNQADKTVIIIITTNVLAHSTADLCILSYPDKSLVMKMKDIRK